MRNKHERDSYHKNATAVYKLSLNFFNIFHTRSFHLVREKFNVIGAIDRTASFVARSARKWNAVNDGRAHTKCTYSRRACSLTMGAPFSAIIRSYNIITRWLSVHNAGAIICARPSFGWHNYRRWHADFPLRIALSASILDAFARSVR